MEKVSYESLQYHWIRAGRVVTLYEQYLSTKTTTHPRAISTFLISFNLCNSKAARLSLSPTLALEIHGSGKSPTNVGSGLEMYVVKYRLSVMRALDNGIKRFIPKQQISRYF